jgi:hypothetical protein
MERTIMPAPSASALAKFTVEKGGDAYRIHIETDGGETMELSATYEQMELLVDTLDELLGADDSGAEVEVEDTH